MTDLLLTRVSAASRAESHWSGSLPLGLGYLAAGARQRGMNVSVVDARMAGHRTLDETVTEIEKHHPGIVGVSSLTVEFPRAVSLATQLKRLQSPPIVVAGGAHVNALPVESMQEAPAIDYMIAGEAEQSLVEFIDDVHAGRPPGSIAGLHSRNEDGSIRQHRPPRYEHAVLDLPFPAWDLFPRTNVFPILSERGCPYACVFCSRNMSRVVRSRPVEHVVEEVRWLITDFDAQSIYFEDETFGLHAERAYSLLDRLARLNNDRRVCFKAQTRVDRITPRMAQMMKRAGFQYLEIGIESGDQTVLDSAQKGIRVKDVEATIHMLSDTGIKTWLNFIIGLPGETTESVRSSIELAVRLNPDRLSVAIIVAYPGSDIYDWASEALTATIC